MLASASELVTVIAPTAGSGQSDSYTGETIAGGTTGSRSVRIVWVDAPRRELQMVRGAGGSSAAGVVQVADAQLLYQTNGSDADVDWRDWIRMGVIVRRLGVDYQPTGIAEWHARGWQLVSLKRREGAQNAGA